MAYSALRVRHSKIKNSVFQVFGSLNEASFGGLYITTGSCALSTRWTNFHWAPELSEAALRPLSTIAKCRLADVTSGLHAVQPVDAPSGACEYPHGVILPIPITRESLLRVGELSSA